MSKSVTFEFSSRIIRPQTRVPKPLSHLGKTKPCKIFIKLSRIEDINCFLLKIPKIVKIYRLRIIRI